MITLPSWAVYAVSFGTPLVTFIGVLVAGAINRKGATELEERSKREETLRVTRWAAELAVEDDPGRAYLGVYELRALAASELLDDAQALFVKAALEAVVDAAADRAEESGQDSAVVQVEDDPG